MSEIFTHYGEYPFRSDYLFEKFRFSFNSESRVFGYSRQTFHNQKKNLLITLDYVDKVIVQPSEPLVSDLPKTHLLLELSEPLVFPPDSEVHGFFDFPISVAILVKTNNKITLIDLFQLLPTKFALYGNSHNGVLCRYWKTSFNSAPIEPKIFETGVLEIEIQNNSSSSITLTRLVLDFAYIELFYNSTVVKAKARARIQSESLCETQFLSPSNVQNFVKSYDLIPTKILSSSKFIMLNGI
ncbi:MAG: DUF432 domain-containing protein [Candidatus Kapaibacteriota bacterium]